MVRHCSTAIVSDLALKGHNVSKCPRGMWTYLSNRFEKVSGTTKMVAFNQLVDTKMAINDVEKFISESNEYYLDSGASDHFVNDPSAFTGLKQMHSTVTTAEGKKSSITGVGDVSLRNVVLKKQS
ncbi:hypothetical protein TYRP_007973 [Tyrophagus putrescentiae]|nr:hypothetical protein TYRP_007973 [Tyrophagus putrescentiae]